ncbi:MAG: VaFE repeat-containing surface-anchored protein [Wujia sp.]
MKIDNRYLKKIISLFLTVILIVLQIMNHWMISYAGAGNTTVESDRYVVSIRANGAQYFDEGSTFLIDSNGISYNAICIGYTQHAPERGTVIDSVYFSDDPYLRKALYYGYGGPENARWSGFAVNSANLEGQVVVTPSEVSLYEAYSRIATGIAASAIYQGYTTQNWLATPFYNYILDPSTPDPNVAASYETYFNLVGNGRTEGKLSVSSFVDGNVQKSEEVCFYGDRKLSITFQVYSPYTVVTDNREYVGSETGTNVTLKGGDCFFVQAPVTHTGSFSLDGISLNQPEYRAMVLVTASDEIQDLGAIRTVYNTVENGMTVDFLAPKGRIYLYKQPECPELVRDNPLYSLEEAVYGVYKSEEDALINKNCLCEIKTDSSGFGESGELLYGSYYIREVSPSKGYMADDRVYEADINSDIPVEIISHEKEKTAEDSILLFKKDKEGIPVQGAQYKIIFYPDSNIRTDNMDEIAPYRSWIFETDGDGYIFFDEEHLISGDELFINEEGNPSLPMGTVLIQEICAPEGYILDTDIYYVDITEDENGNVYHNMATSTEKKLVPVIKTLATDKKTGSHTATIGENSCIVDCCSYSGLIQDREYRLVGTLVDGLTGEPIADRAGKIISVSKTFIAGESGTEELEFSLCGFDLEGKRVVVFEELYRDDTLVAYHRDLEDYNQTVYFPYIHTELLDEISNSHTLMLQKDLSLCDNVFYEGLDVNATYRLRGKLFRKSTGEVLRDKNGHELVEEIAFAPDNETGCVQVNFMFDCTGIELYGEDIICFEYLYLNDTLIVSHEDISGIQSVTCDLPNPPIVLPFTHVPDTGDYSCPTAMFLLLFLSVIGIVFFTHLVIKREKTTKNK